MNVKPKFVYYDIRRKQSVSLIMYTHENDVDTQVLEVSMLDNGEPIELDADYTYTAAIVNRDTKALINDNISCELNDSGNVLIPIDNFHTLGAQDLLIELTITDSAGDQVLVTPFPLWIHVNASILDDAQVTPESLGTVPELLEEAQEALENVGDYDNLTHKPQINGHELFGNKTGDDLGLQNKLTAGENVTIDANGEISATGGTNDYEELDNLPLIEGFYGFQDSKNDEVVKKYVRAPLKGRLWFAEEDFKACHFESPPNAYEAFLITLSENVFFSRMDVTGFGPYNFKNLYSERQNRTGIFPINRSQVQNLPPELEIFDGNFFITHYFQRLNPADNIESLPFIRYASGKDSNGEFVVFAQIATAQFDTLNWSNVKNESNWVRMSNVTISSATVNQNGTITFTMSDGSTVTTTGESVIGESAYQVAVDNGFIGTEQEWLASLKGEQGDDYVLTPQDKSDIAAIVLSELPTTQGVQYGNSND